MLGGGLGATGGCWKRGRGSAGGLRSGRGNWPATNFLAGLQGRRQERSGEGILGLGNRMKTVEKNLEFPNLVHLFFKISKGDCNNVGTHKEN
ncbi:hypothetical protein MA16_Dca018064 [Dendrobium catenatum]|uniref:Uncharacterized protein n=1 Tax=Dendrobium catenatum TaxID=906689 RepID=A0A2I0XHY6_9ASPA|nr:hypothetical protein MA16_Dca018064 [Dendrobium catenatum]